MGEGGWLGVVEGCFGRIWVMGGWSYWCGCSAGDICILARPWHGLSEDSEWSSGRRRIVLSFYGGQIAGPELFFTTRDVRGGVDLYTESLVCPLHSAESRSWRALRAVVGCQTFVETARASSFAGGGGLHSPAYIVMPYC